MNVIYHEPKRQRVKKLKTCLWKSTDLRLSKRDAAALSTSCVASALAMAVSVCAL